MAGFRKLGSSYDLFGQIKRYGQGGWKIRFPKILMPGTQIGISFACTILLLAETGAAVDGSARPKDLVQITINADYDDSPGKIAQLKELINLLPPIKIQVKQGDTISGIILDYYSFGISNSPEAYREIEMSIRDWNALESPEELKLGPLWIPGIPKRALRENTLSRRRL